MLSSPGRQCRRRGDELHVGRRRERRGGVQRIDRTRRVDVPDEDPGVRCGDAPLRRGWRRPRPRRSQRPSRAGRDRQAARSTPKTRRSTRAAGRPRRGGRCCLGAAVISSYHMSGSACARTASSCGDPVGPGSSARRASGRDCRLREEGGRVQWSARVQTVSSAEQGVRGGAPAVGAWRGRVRPEPLRPVRAGRVDRGDRGARVAGRGARRRGGHQTGRRPRAVSRSRGPRAPGAGRAQRRRRGSRATRGGRAAGGARRACRRRRGGRRGDRSARALPAARPAAAPAGAGAGRRDLLRHCGAAPGGARLRARRARARPRGVRRARRSHRRLPGAWATHCASSSGATRSSRCGPSRSTPSGARERWTAPSPTRPSRRIRRCPSIRRVCIR